MSERKLNVRGSAEETHIGLDSMIDLDVLLNEYQKKITGSDALLGLYRQSLRRLRGIFPDAPPWFITSTALMIVANDPKIEMEGRPRRTLDDVTSGNSVTAKRRQIIKNMLTNDPQLALEDIRTNLSEHLQCQPIPRSTIQQDIVLLRSLGMDIPSRKSRKRRQKISNV